MADWGWRRDQIIWIYVTPTDLQSPLNLVSVSTYWNDKPLVNNQSVSQRKDEKGKGTTTIQERNIWSTAEAALCVQQGTRSLKSPLPNASQPWATAPVQRMPVPSTWYSLPVWCLDWVAWCGAQTAIWSPSTPVEIFISIIAFGQGRCELKQPLRGACVYFCKFGCGRNHRGHVIHQVLFLNNQGATAHTKH